MGALNVLGSAMDKLLKGSPNKLDAASDPAAQGKMQKKQAAINAMPGQEAPQFGTQTSPQMNQIPMYAQGGDVSKDQVAHVDAGERVLNPEEAHAYHSAAAGQAPLTLLGRIADRAHELYNQGAALVSPMNSEADALKEKQQNVNTAQHQIATENKPLGTINYAPVASDQVHPGATYGSRPGEQRIDPNELNSMMKPLGAAPAMEKLPSYDEGGDVPGDQTAQLGAGEHVLDPDKAAAYRQAEAEVKGAPADFGGQVLAKPKGIKPQSDTDQPDIRQRMAGGAKMNTDLAPHGGPKMNDETTPMNQMEPGMVREASARTPLGDTGAQRLAKPSPLGDTGASRSSQPKDLPHSEQIEPVHGGGDGSTDHEPMRLPPVHKLPPNTVGQGMPQGPEAAGATPVQHQAPIGRDSLGQAYAGRGALQVVPQAASAPAPAAPAEVPPPDALQMAQEDAKKAQDNVKMEMFKKDQEDAMKKGPDGLRDLGTSKIHENMLGKAAPEASNLPQAPQLPPENKSTPAYTGLDRIGKGTPGEAELHKEYQDEAGDQIGRA